MMRALLYLEWHYVRNQVLAIVRSPWRVGLWLPYTLFIGYLFTMRVIGGHRGASGSTLLGVYPATGIGGIYLGMLGVSIALAASGRIAGFRSRAEAVLLANAGISPIAMALWLQGRRLSLSSGRYLGTLAYVFLVFSPSHVGVAAAARALFATVLAIAVPLGAELPIFLFARGARKYALRVGGFVLAAVGFGFAAAGFLARDAIAPFVRATGIDPGRLTNAVLAGQPATIAALLAVLGLSALAIRRLGNDALPELYAMSQAPIRTLGSGRRARSESAVAPGADTTRTIRSSDARVPRGALALVWKDWVAFKRRPGVPMLWLAGAAFWLVCGIAVGTLYARYHDLSLVLTLAGASAILVFVGTPSAAALDLANDLGKPLFWLSHAPLRARIAAWTFARTWRGATAIVLAPLAASVVLHATSFAIAAYPIVFATMFALQSLGLGLYAFFPNPLDTRGPMVFVRLMATAAFAVPAILIAVVVAALSGNDLLAFVACAATLALEGWIVIELASLYFRDHGAHLEMLARST